MIVVIYAVSIVLFCIAAFIAPVLFAPIVLAYRSMTRQPVLPTTHPVLLLPFVLATFVLLYLTAYVWHRLGYRMSWLFPTLVALVHLLFAGARGANRGNQLQAYGVVFGVVVYAISTVF